MCGRFRNLQSWSDPQAALTDFRAAPTQPALNLKPREQVRPTRQAPIVTIDDANAVQVWKARWCLIPWFHKGTVKDWKATAFNARPGTVATLRAYRDAFAKRRCLAVADGWYAWKRPGESDEKRKQPWSFTPHGSALVMLPGIWDSCETTDEGRVASTTVVTRPAGAPPNGYHDRAPVVLFGDDWRRWPDTSEHRRAYILATLAPVGS